MAADDLFVEQLTEWDKLCTEEVAEMQSQVVTQEAFRDIF